MPHLITRYHDICCGHRVVGHEGKCRNLHGHNYRIHFTCASNVLDDVGRVIDFGVVKERLCEAIERKWDHKFLMWEEDILAREMDDFGVGVILVPFNPTAENIARFLVEEIGPAVLPPDIRLVRVVVEETAKCSATYEVAS